jgi:hypothetical protein
MAKPSSNEPGRLRRATAAGRLPSSMRSRRRGGEMVQARARNWQCRAGKFGGRRTCRLEPHREFVVAQFEAVPHLTLNKLEDLLAARRIVVSHDMVAFPAAPRAVLQKSLTLSRGAGDQEERVGSRWPIACQETWIKTNIAPIRGWERRAAEGLRARRPLAHAPSEAAALTRLASSMPAGASPWRHRYPRPRRRRQARVPATLLTGLRSDRAGIRQGQALAAQWPRHDRSRPSTTTSQGWSAPSLKANALTTSAKPDMLPA